MIADQLNLFHVPEPLPSRATDPETSRVAADTHKRVAASHRAVVFAAVSSSPGMTYRQIALYCGIDAVEVMRRLGDLQRKGLVWKGPAIRDPQTGGLMSTWRTNAKG